MAGRNTAAAMLAAGRDRVTHPEADAPEQRRERKAPERTRSEPSAPVAQATRRPVAQYEKASFFLTPEQRSWVDSTVHELNLKGISGSDVVRLALTRLQEDAEKGLPIAEELIEQAYQEAEQFPGRKNRGLPPRTARSA